MTRLPPAALIAITTFGLTAGALAMGAVSVDALRSGKNTVYANETTETIRMQSLVNKLATRFSLKEGDVQAVFDEDRTERRQEMQLRMETVLNDRLDAAVSIGKITKEQKSLILAKHEELQKQRETDRESWQSKTPEERRTAMLELRTELEAWAKENNIDAAYIMGEGRGMMDRGDGMGWGGRHGGMGEAPLSN